MIEPRAIIVIGALVVIATLAGIGALTLRERLERRRPPSKNAQRSAFVRWTSSPEYMLIEQIAGLATTDVTLEVVFERADLEGSTDGELTITRGGASAYVSYDGCADVVSVAFSNSDEELWLDETGGPESALEQIASRLPSSTQPR